MDKKILSSFYLSECLFIQYFVKACKCCVAINDEWFKSGFYNTCFEKLACLITLKIFGELNQAATLMGEVHWDTSLQAQTLF